MTHITVKNLALGVRSFRDAAGKMVVLEHQQARSSDVHPHHAYLMLREAGKPNATLEVDISDEERVAMEQTLAEGRTRTPSPSQPSTQTSFPHADEARMRLGNGGNRRGQEPVQLRENTGTSPAPAAKPYKSDPPASKSKKVRTKKSAKGNAGRKREKKSPQREADSDE